MKTSRARRMKISVQLSFVFTIPTNAISRRVCHLTAGVRHSLHVRIALPRGRLSYPARTKYQTSQLHSFSCGVSECEKVPISVQRVWQSIQADTTRGPQRRARGSGLVREVYDLTVWRGGLAFVPRTLICIMYIAKFTPIYLNPP
jgi:hypothetical protein